MRSIILISEVLTMFLSGAPLLTCTYSLDLRRDEDRTELKTSCEDPKDCSSQRREVIS